LFASRSPQAIRPLGQALPAPACRLLLPPGSISRRLRQAPNATGPLPSPRASLPADRGADVGANGVRVRYVLGPDGAAKEGDLLQAEVRILPCARGRRLHVGRPSVLARRTPRSAGCYPGATQRDWYDDEQDVSARNLNGPRRDRTSDPLIKSSEAQRTVRSATPFPRCLQPACELEVRR
jgi:hypothetical protein